MQATISLGAGRDDLALARGPNRTVGLGGDETDIQAGAGSDGVRVLGVGAYRSTARAAHPAGDGFGITQIVLRFVDAATLVLENLGN